MLKQDIRKVYRVQVLGVSYEDENKELEQCSEEILTTDELGINENWIDGFSKVYGWFIYLSNLEFQAEWFNFDEVLIQIQYGEIIIPKFESKWDLDFDLENDDVQEAIPYELNYGWANILELYRTN